MDPVRVYSRSVPPDAPAPKRVCREISPHEAAFAVSDRIDTSGLRVLSSVAVDVLRFPERLNAPVASVIAKTKPVESQRPAHDSNFRAALDHYRDKEFEQARRLFREAGTPDASYYLGTLHERGRGGPVNYAEARRLYAESGTSDAKNNLGMMHQDGDGGPVDYVEARRLYAESGSPDAKNNLGTMHQEGLGVPVDPIKARQLFAKSKTPDAKNNLARMHHKGLGGPIDYVKARKLFAESATPDAKDSLGVMHLNGLGGPVNYAEARRLFSESGLSYAKSKLGGMHLKGLGGPVNYIEARRLFAESGTPRAKATLALMLFKGLGGPENLAEAKRLVIESGAPKHELFLERIESTLRDRDLATPTDELLASGTPAAQVTAARQFVSGSKGTSSHDSEQNFINVIAGTSIPLPERLSYVQTILMNIENGKTTMTPPALVKLLSMSHELTASATDPQKLALFDRFSQAAKHTS